MYASPRIADFGRIEVHTYALPGSAPEVDETATLNSAGGGAAGIGLLGIAGAAAVMAGRGNDDQPVAGVAADEEEKQAQK